MRTRAIADPIDRPRTASVDLDVGLAEASLGYLVGAMGACVVLLSRDLGVPRDHVSWLSAGFGVALLVAGPTGPLLLRGGPFLLLRCSSLVLAVGASLLAVAPVLLAAQLGAVALGAGAAGIVLAAPALLTGPTAARRLSVVNAVASLAGVLGPLALSVTDLLPGTGRLALLLAVPPLLRPILRGAPRPAPPPAPPTPPPAPPTPPPAVAPEPPGPVTVPDRTADGRWAAARPVAARWLAMVLSVTAEFAFALWGAARLQDSGLSVSAAAAGAAAFPLGMATGRTVGARLIDRGPVVPVSVVLVLTGTGLLLLPTPPAGCVVALGVAGLGIAVLYPVTLTRMMHSPGLGDARASALGATASGTAILAGPLMIGALTNVGSLRTAFLGVVPLMLLLLLLQRSA